LGRSSSPIGRDRRDSRASGGVPEGLDRSPQQHIDQKGGHSFFDQRPSQTNTTDLMTALELRVIREDTTKTAVNRFLFLNLKKKLVLRKTQMK
jgi:hypothetical protein